MTGPEDDLARNTQLWTDLNAQLTDDYAFASWGTQTVRWGLFEQPEAELGVLGDVAGLDVVELGCGTAFLSASLARLGARPVGVDPTPAQLETARRCQDRFDLHFPLVESGAERVPLPTGTFDLAVSEYGASVWCDPARWLPEAARLLRPGGRLVFLTNSVLLGLCVPADGGYAVDGLLRPQRDLRRVEWPGAGVEFHPSHGEWIGALRAAGFQLEALHELYAAVDARTHEFYEIATAEWARQWPVEDLWVAGLPS